MKLNKQKKNAMTI